MAKEAHKAGSFAPGVEGGRGLAAAISRGAVPRQSKPNNGMITIGDDAQGRGRRGEGAEADASHRRGRRLPSRRRS